MCGLAGMVLPNDRPFNGDPEALVKKMCDVQAHRGPDDWGVHRAGRAVLGSRRLAILDLSPAGHMPMSDATGRWWIAYNGEVFNFAEIRTELESLGHVFRSKTDTEVILHAYMQWGRACMHRFIGMFAFAITDTQTGSIALVRDRYGIKPLYYVVENGTMYFASEIKALLKVVATRRINQQSLSEWMLYRNVDSLTPYTLFAGISSVLPGQMVDIEGAEIKVSKWYSPLDFISSEDYADNLLRDPAELVKSFDTLLDDAVQKRLISDVPVGTLASGGLDSSLITAIAAQYTKKLSAFHVSIEGFPDLDERKYAERLTGSLGLPFIPFSLNGNNFRRALAQSVYFSDLPLSHPNTVAYYLISKVAREHGTIVLLSGEGADETFGGYAWNYRRKRLMFRLQKWMDRVPRPLAEFAELIVYANAGMPVTAHRFREVLPLAVEFLDRHERRDWSEQCNEAYDFVAKPGDRVALGAMVADLGDFLTPLLRRLDRASMGASVECRVPFLDHRLVHRAINLPVDYKVGKRADKWVLKEVARKYLPNDLIDRKKAGFPLPFAAYLEPLAQQAFFRNGYCQEQLGLSSRAFDRILRRWEDRVFGLFGFVTLEIWGRLHMMDQSLDEVTAHIEMCERVKKH